MDSFLIETNKIKIAKYSMTRFDEIYELYQDKEIIKYTTVDGKQKTREEVIKGINAYNTLYAQTNNKQGKWLIIDKKENQVVGYIGLFYIEEIGMYEISYGVISEYTGKGYATEAALQMQNYAIGDIEITNICSLIREENLSSIKVAEKCGLTFQNERINLWGFEFMIYKLMHNDDK